MRGRVGGIRQSRSPLGNIVATRRQCSSARGGECGLRKEAPAPLDRVNEDGGRNTAREGTCTVQGVPSELRLGFVDLDFECSTVFPTLLGLMGIRQKRLGNMGEHPNLKSIQLRSRSKWDTLYRMGQNVNFLNKQ